MDKYEQAGRAIAGTFFYASDTIENGKAIAAFGRRCAEEARAEKNVSAYSRVLLNALERAQEDINWMINNQKFLNPDVFDYIDDTVKSARALTVAAPSAEPKDAIPPNCSCQESSPARLVVHRNDGPCYVRERRDPWCDNCDLHFEAHDGPGRKCPTGGKEYHGPAEPKKETM